MWQFAFVQLNKEMLMIKASFSFPQVAGLNSSKPVFRKYFFTMTHTKYIAYHFL